MIVPRGVVISLESRLLMNTKMLETAMPLRKMVPPFVIVPMPSLRMGTVDMTRLVFSLSRTVMTSETLGQLPTTPVIWTVCVPSTRLSSRIGTWKVLTVSPSLKESVPETEV